MKFSFIVLWETCLTLLIVKIKKGCLNYISVRFLLSAVVCIVSPIYTNSPPPFQLFTFRRQAYARSQTIQACSTAGPTQEADSPSWERQTGKPPTKEARQASCSLTKPQVSSPFFLSRQPNWLFVWSPQTFDTVNSNLHCLLVHTALTHVLAFVTEMKMSQKDMLFYWKDRTVPCLNSKYFLPFFSNFSLIFAGTMERCLLHDQSLTLSHHCPPNPKLCLGTGGRSPWILVRTAWPTDDWLSMYFVNMSHMAPSRIMLMLMKWNTRNNAPYSKMKCPELVQSCRLPLLSRVQTKQQVESSPRWNIT